MRMENHICARVGPGELGLRFWALRRLLGPRMNIGELALALVEVSEPPERPERSPSAAERSESTSALVQGTR
jgi:hypothetical protein